MGLGEINKGGRAGLQSNSGCPVQVGQHDFVVGSVNGLIRSSLTTVVGWTGNGRRFQVLNSLGRVG